MKFKNIAIITAFITAIVLPLIMQASANYYAIHVLGLLGIYAILCVGLNITIGYTGLLDLGFMAFYAIGAYIGIILSAKGISFWYIIPISLFIGGTFRYLLGAPVLRLRGDYLAIVTLAFGEITRLLLNNLDFLTNGPKGLPRVGETVLPISIFSFTLRNDIHFYYLIVFFLALAIIVSYRLEHSRLGRAFVAIREDETAAELSGINVSNTKLLAFVISGMFGSLAGTIYAHWIGFISPESFTFWESIFLVCMLVIGGMGSISGAILGAFILAGIPEFLRPVLGSGFIDYRMLIFGLLLVVVIIFRPQGLLPSKRRNLELRMNKNSE
ncbi:MAG: hypothetical protein A2252_08235 [Elusimicrobia bacterium RIFOXYA2_FULL_39_19]|nr:MAG: hypothetical protein A2252_08235 [Elusimicrobia bacterium RIFOXYA2_FULL_39_19]